MIFKLVPRRLLFLGAGAILAPLAAGAIAHTTRARAAQLAQAVNDTVMKTEAQAAELLQHSARRPDRRGVTRALENFERRRADLQEPALVIAELTAACRAAGANIEGIRPLAARGGMTQHSVLSPQSSPPRYQLIVRADYATQARLMDACSRRRLPVRVVGFTIAPFEGEAVTGQLRGEITVEAYQPAVAAMQEPKP